jgi:PAS domain S-box-containing protein
MGDTARNSTLHRFGELEERSRLGRKSVSYSLLALFARCFSLSLLYYVLVVVSMKLRFSTSGLSLLWPSNALLIATLVLTPKRRWWVYLLSIIPAHIAALSPYHLGLPWLAYQIAFNSSQAIACAVILQRFRPAILYFETLKEVLIFLGVSVVVPGLANLVAIYPVVKYSSRAGLLAHNSSDGFLAVWTSCWANNSASLIVFVPVILICVTRGRDCIRSLSRRGVGEAALLTVLLTTLTFLMYGNVHSVGDALPFVYLIPVPFLIWAAVRFGPAGACLSIALFVCVSSWCAYLGQGPFLRSVSIDRVTVLQMAWIIISAPLFCLAAVVRERRAAVEELSESEQRFRLVANTAPVMIWMSGPDKLCTYFNQPWLEFTGRTLEAELGNGWVEGVHPEDSKECLDTYTRAFDLRESFKMQYRLRRHDGEYRWVFDIGVPRVDADGSFAGYIGSCIDVTDRKLAEQAMAEIRRKLIEAQEQERTRIGRELHDDVTQRLALLAVELAQLEHDPSDVQSRVGKLRKEITEISNDVQALSHELHSSKLEYLGVVAGIRSWCKEFGERQKMKIDFKSDVAAVLPFEIGVCLFRVLQEALHNAAKHSEVKDVEVCLLEQSNQVHLIVSDSGKGFDVESAIQDKGLGLTSMRERVRLVNGTVAIESKPMGGTTIEVRVPLESAHSSQRAS